MLTDGRTANARFLKANLQREWRYEHDEDGDVHYFEMIEEPLGKWNRRQIELCLGADWRAKPLRFRDLRLMIRAAARSAFTGRLDQPQSEAVPVPAAKRTRAAA